MHDQRLSHYGRRLQGAFLHSLNAELTGRQRRGSTRLVLRFNDELDLDTGWSLGPHCITEDALQELHGLGTYWHDIRRPAKTPGLVEKPTGKIDVPFQIQPEVSWEHDVVLRLPM
jgi:hypothetical protein